MRIIRHIPFQYQCPGHGAVGSLRVGLKNIRKIMSLLVQHLSIHTNEEGLHMFPHPAIRHA